MMLLDRRRPLDPALMAELLQGETGGGQSAGISNCEAGGGKVAGRCSDPGGNGIQYCVCLE